MPRIARIVIPDEPYHVTQRGNDRQDVFFTEDDRRVYLELLAEQAERYALDVLGWCLMTNHVHLVVIPRWEESLAEAVGRTHWRYTRQVNHRRRRSGHLWQNRFFSCVLDEARVISALRYVEQNPVRARMTRVPWTYEWSSASAHVGGGDRWGLLDLRAWRRDWTEEAWRHMLRQGLEVKEVDALRSNTMRGRPLGSEGFIRRIEQRIGRLLRSRPVGRPPRTATSGDRRRGGDSYGVK